MLISILLIVGGIVLFLFGWKIFDSFQHDKRISTLGFQLGSLGFWLTVTGVLLWIF